MLSGCIQYVALESKSSILGFDSNLPDCNIVLQLKAQRLIVSCPQSRPYEQEATGSLGLPARTRTWNHRLGGGSYILFNYRENASFYLKVLAALLNAALGLGVMRPRSVKGIRPPLARYL